MKQPTIFEYLYPQYKIKNHVRLIELFGGYGSQAMAMRNIGADFERYKLVEFDKFACNSYNSVHGTNFETKDIMETHADDLEIVDRDNNTYIMFYSFPCTDISAAGLRKGMEKGSGTRSGLLWEVERILLECKEKNCLPQILVMENVPAVHDENNIKDFLLWKKALEEMGYSNYEEDLNSKDFGSAQTRNRCFMVSILGEYSYTFPEKLKGSKTVEDILQPEPVNEKLYIPQENIEWLNVEKRVKRGSKRCVRVGDTNMSNYDQANRIYDEHYLAPTCTAQGEPAMIAIYDDNNPDNVIVRRLTPRECGRLQGVTDEDIDRMSNVNGNAQLYKQFGNSICVNVLEQLFKQLY